MNEAVAIAQAVKHLRENMPAMLELAQLQAQLANARYDALIQAGFGPEQAMELCQKRIEI